jgi:GWxTD domain-containing protein
MARNRAGQQAAFAFLTFAAALHAAAPDWLARVAPVMTPAEKSAYLALRLEARAKFEADFWADKAITAEEFFKRVAYIDSTFGSNRTGSGANTDQGRVYLSLGPPTRVMRLSSSRVFVPLEIWYYDNVPGVLNTELRLIFYRKNSMGFPALYSPTLATIRTLLLPQASTRSLFGSNDSLSESDIRQKLSLGPAEDEVITASVNVASGIKATGNDEILGRVLSPEAMLGKPLLTEVRSRMVTSHPKLDVFQTTSPYGGSQVDLRLEVAAQQQIDLEVMADAATLYQSQLHLKFSKAEPILYLHRLDLLPGTYRLVFTVDGKVHPYAIEVAKTPSMGQMMGQILRADWGGDVAGRQTPLEFAGRQLDLKPDGRYAVVALGQPGKVTWMIRRGMEVLWRSTTAGGPIAMVELPTSGLETGLPQGVYKLEAVTEKDSRMVDFAVKPESGVASNLAVVSFNANLAPASRLTFLGHQWLLRGKLVEARQCLQAGLSKGVTGEAEIELARADALLGNLDSARDRVRRVLAVRPDSFEALSVYAYVETQFQDYLVAADLYRRALAVQDSPALRAALAKLPVQ